MKLVLNKTYGAFEMPPEIMDKYGYESQYDSIARDNPDLIEYVKRYGYVCRGTDLRVVTISDEATDFEILEYDGVESVVYVVGGKLCWA